MSKRLLILQACGIESESWECENLKAHAKHYHMGVDDHCVKDNAHLAEIMSNILQKQLMYDYIYLSSHGNKEIDGFKSENGKVYSTWDEFGNELCISECLNENCIVMLSCCRAGLNHVAFELFLACDYIDYVIGPREKLSSVEMINAFNIVMFNLEHRDIDPVRACKKVEEGIDIRKMCFDREETVETYSYKMFELKRNAEYAEEPAEEIEDVKLKVEANGVAN